jgi:hypothetical protein
MRGRLRICRDGIRTAFHSDLAASGHRVHLISVRPNASDQRLAIKWRTISLDSIASPLHRLVRRDLAHLLSKELLILVVVTDPIPEESIILEDRQSSIASADANRPDGPALLESQGWMPWVSLPETICSTRPAPDVRRKTAIRGPKVSRCR